MKLRLLRAEDLRRALPMPAAVAAMKQAFAALSSGRATVPQRVAVAVEDEGAVTLVMPALLRDEPRGLGAKLVSVFPGNAGRGKPVVTGLVVALDPATGEPAAICDGTFLTAWRTGAASGAATDLLARQDARVAAVFGCGAQARTQALAIDAVRELELLRVYARTPESVARFVAEMAPRVRASMVAAASPDEAVDGAEIVCAATSSPRPVFDGRRLAAGVHVNGVGSFTPEMQEVDAETVRRSRVFVDQRQAALAEAGDLVIAVRDGATDPADWIEIGEVAAGSQPGRQTSEDLTFFKSVGVAVQDVAAVAAALVRAEALGLGTEIEL
jgi:ornithine cyclodeaminase